MMDGKVPRFSVIVPVRNCIDSIKETVESVLSQDYSGDVECIVVDGASTDGTLELVRQFGDTITLISEPDRGIYHALNKGILASSGDLIGMLAAGDTLRPGAMTSLAVACTETDGPVIVAGSVYRTAEKREVLRSCIPPLAIRNSKLMFESVYISRDALALSGLFDISFPVSADYNLLAGLLSLNVPVCYTDDIVLNLEPFGYSASPRAQRQKEWDHYRTQWRYVGRGYAAKRLITRRIERVLRDLKRKLVFQPA